MRIFALSIAMILSAALCMAQAPTRETLENTDSDDKIIVKRNINNLVDQWNQLSHSEDEFSDANAVIRKAGFDTRIAECTTLRDAAANANARILWQNNINALTARRDLLDDNTPSTASEDHPRWEAGQLTTTISDLLDEINDLKAELTALP